MLREGQVVRLTMGYGDKSNVQTGRIKNWSFSDGQFHMDLDMTEMHRGGSPSVGFQDVKPLDIERDPMVAGYGECSSPAAEKLRAGTEIHEAIDKVLHFGETSGRPENPGPTLSNERRANLVGEADEAEVQQLTKKVLDAWSDGVKPSSLMLAVTKMAVRADVRNHRIMRRLDNLEARVASLQKSERMHRDAWENIQKLYESRQGQKAQMIENLRDEFMAEHNSLVDDVNQLAAFCAGLGVGRGRQIERRKVGKKRK